MGAVTVAAMAVVTVEAARAPAGHIVLCGLRGLGFRTLEELHRLGEEVVVIAHAPSETLAAGACELGVTVIDGSYREESVLRAARVDAASALVVTEDDDVGNLHAALAAQDLNPALRVVLRMFNMELGNRVQRLFRDCVVLSDSAIAAPAFVSAALHEGWEQRFEVAGRVIVVRQGSGSEPEVLLPLARLHGDGSAEILPVSGDDLLCLVDERRPPGAGPSEPDPAQHRGRRRMLPGVLAASAWSLLAADRRLRWLMADIAVLALLSVFVFSRFGELSLVDAVYFTVTTMTTTGYGDINLLEKPAALKLYGVALMVLGAAMLAILYALIIDVIVGARLSRNAGVPRGMRDHIVVCGLGNIGYRVVEQVARMGLPVTAVELDGASLFLAPVRRLGIPVMVADARLPETLQALNLAEARCLLVATNDDVANLETALNGRTLNPELRVVLRLFDPDLAARVERAFDIHISRSPSALAAPAFAAAAVSERVLATVPIGVQVLIVAQTRIESGSHAAGATVSLLEQRTEARVLLLSQDGWQIWRPPGEKVLAPGQELVVVTTREGLAQVLASTESATVPGRN